MDLARKIGVFVLNLFKHADNYKE